MRSKQFVGVAMLMLAGLSGCVMCDNSLDYGYTAFGGKWQRHNPYSGRVASLFDPAGSQVVVSGVPTETEWPLEFLEAEEDIGDPLMDEFLDEAFEAVPPESVQMPEDQAVGHEARPGDDQESMDEKLDLPSLPGDSREKPLTEPDAGSLPPLDPPP